MLAFEALCLPPKRKPAVRSFELRESAQHIQPECCQSWSTDQPAVVIYLDLGNIGIGENPASHGHDAVVLAGNLVDHCDPAVGMNEGGGTCFALQWQQVLLLNRRAIKKGSRRA